VHFLGRSRPAVVHQYGEDAASPKNAQMRRYRKPRPRNKEKGRCSLGTAHFD
jgi:hypothetical protein